MSEGYDVTVRVISQQGDCAAGHRIGDEWVIKDGKTPPGLCIYALNALFPFSRVLAFDGAFPWETDPDTCTAACPDAENPVVFELRRIKLATKG